jgi:hypothetical protein
VQDPLPISVPACAQRSSKRACKKKISPGYASLAGGLRKSNEICRYALACLDKSLNTINASAPMPTKKSVRLTPINGANH